MYYLIPPRTLLGGCTAQGDAISDRDKRDDGIEQRSLVDGPAGLTSILDTIGERACMHEREREKLV